MTAGLGAAIVGFAACVPSAPADAPRASLEIFALLTIVPLAEEWFFRGLLLDACKTWFGAPWAVIAVSLVFAGLHAQPAMGAVAFVLSALLCATVFATRSLTWAVGLHMLWNGLAVVHRTDVEHGRFGLGIALAAVALFLSASGARPPLREAPR